MPTPQKKPNYAEIAKKHGGVTLAPAVEGVGRESKYAYFPPELSRIERSLGPKFVVGKPYTGYQGKAISSVGEHEPHKIEINDPKGFALGPLQTKGHEEIHLWQNQLPGGIQSKILPDGPKNPYSLENIDELRKQGHTLATLPREVGATIIQRYIASPADRARLQKWIDDIPKTPLSIMEPTGPNDKTINRNVRPLIPPQEAYMPIKQLVEEAKKRRPK